MSGFAEVLVVLAVAVLIVVRQIRPQRAADGGHWWLMPAVLIYLGLRGPIVFDGGRGWDPELLLIGELTAGLLMGAVWAWTSRQWAEADRSVWLRGTRATVAVRAGGIASQLALAGVGVLLGIHQGTGALLLTLAASLLARSGVLEWRVRSLRPADGLTAAYGGVPEPQWGSRP